MTRVRRLGTTAMIVLVALVSAPMIGIAPANAADAEILSPADGAVVKSSGAVAVSAKTDWYQISMALYIEGPSVSRQKIASGGANQTISGSFDPGDAPNGTFTVSLFGEVTHKTYATSTFVLSRPPEAPSGVEAQLKNPSTILVSWAKGAEPDLQSYEITSVKAGKSGSVSADSACSGSTCQTRLALPSGLGGQKVDVSVRAFRSDGTGGTVASQRSAAVYVTVPAPKPSPSPSPTPSKKPGQAAVKSPAAKTPKTHQTTAVPNPEPALPQNTALPKDTEPPKDTELTLPEANGGSDQTEPVVIPEKTDDPKMTAQSSFLPLGGLSFGVYVALAVVLLLTGANLGAWLRRKGLTSDSAGEGRSGGSEPRPVAGKTGASPQAATVASGAAAFGGAATAKARGKAPVRRPSVILARPKARENLPEAEGDTETLLGAVSSTSESTGTIPGVGTVIDSDTGTGTIPGVGAGTDTIPGVGAGTDTIRHTGQETALSDQEPAASLDRPDRQEPLSAAAESSTADSPTAEISSIAETSPGVTLAAEATSAAPTTEDRAPGDPASGAHPADGSASGANPSNGASVDSAVARAAFPTSPSGVVMASAAAGESPVQSALDQLASLPPLTARLDDGGRTAPDPVSLSPAAQPGQMPVVPAPVVRVPAVPAGAAFNGEMPERPLRQPEPDVWTEDDDSLYSGRHRDL
ncbi:hypothetical protein [Microbispora siamensis]|uniref:Fibronectin type-III domain-containing protein n=1 Tax=Microbispora siamensis TaxID=564413 RepID=A0ABQ4GRM2_9ACTN|nr:hypothetical protein [Microbispora siamensis]GIH64000.1 hypothetical protein Msi02_48170 [Microbispora siamensis]